MQNPCRRESKVYFDRLVVENEKVVAEADVALGEISDKLDVKARSELEAARNAFGGEYLKNKDKNQDKTKGINAGISVELLGNFIDHKNVVIRGIAVKSIRKINMIRALEYVIYKLRCEFEYNDDTRFETLFDIERIGDERAVPVLLEALQDKNIGIAIQASNTLKKIGTEEVVDEARVFKNSDDDDELRCTSRMLGLMDSKDAYECLAKALKHEKKHVRVEAAFAFAQRMDSRGIRRLRKFKTSKNRKLRSRASKRLVCVRVGVTNIRQIYVHPIPRPIHVFSDENLTLVEKSKD